MKSLYGDYRRGMEQRYTVLDTKIADDSIEHGKTWYGIGKHDSHHRCRLLSWSSDEARYCTCVVAASW